MLRIFHRQHWIVCAKETMDGRAQVLRYLGRYTHPIAIFNDSLLGFGDDDVTFRWKGSSKITNKRTRT